jgi:hypothetical protein
LTINVMSIVTSCESLQKNLCIIIIYSLSSYSASVK